MLFRLEGTGSLLPPNTPPLCPNVCREWCVCWLQVLKRCRTTMRPHPSSTKLPREDGDTGAPSVLHDMPNFPSARGGKWPKPPACRISRTTSNNNVPEPKWAHSTTLQSRPTAFWSSLHWAHHANGADARQHCQGWRSTKGPQPPALEWLSSPF